ncbi:unnamed protein product [Phytomonas sp. Hart1]|nr:unnamed protein product [Phytomonas sp. Hart1]|eukprot:CCW68987.1 unnamed protein product [Phytomonas sp. isolate Hart1]
MISLSESKANGEKNAVEDHPAKGRHPGVPLQSIRNYHVLLDLQDPYEPLERRPPGYHLLHTGSSIGRENLNRLRHNFKHIQYTKQVELIDYLQWRSSQQDGAKNNSKFVNVCATKVNSTI